VSSTWILWIVASYLTGNPLVGLAIVLAAVWLGDRSTFRILPSPARTFARWRRADALRRALAVNPHDRRARLELADLVLARRPAEAASLARANVEAGDEDVHTLFLLGAGYARCGEADAAERVLGAARALEPGFRMGEIDLELGRLRLARGDAAGAREAAERLVLARPGSVQARWILASALRRLGDVAGVERARAAALAEYRAMPRFRRREERRWAWRLHPARAAVAIGAAALGAAAALAGVAALLGGR
jgi:tetratricopeptide (TPR) repeat protein